MPISDSSLAGPIAAVAPPGTEQGPSTAPAAPSRPLFRVLLVLAALAVVAILVWQGVTAAGNPDPMVNTGSASAVLDISVLVFREGLECILVLSAITGGMVRANQPQRRPIATGAAVAAVATLITWFIAIRIVDALTESVPALDVQAATGLLAIIVLLVVMNWFFHKLYWTGWISMHNRRKRSLLHDASTERRSRRRVALGLALLGFSSFYREGFEVVLFLQNYRLKLGGTPVLHGVLIGVFLSGLVAILTFVAHRRLPYRRMLVLTGVLLGVVLLVMVGEQAQEMQIAHWIPTTPVHALVGVIPGWMGLWFSVFPTVETLVAQGAAGVLVIGSYFVARSGMRWGTANERTAA